MPLPLLEEIEICRTNLRISPTIIPQTTKVLSQASKGISLEALGFNNVHRFSNMIVTSPRGTPNLDMYALFNIRSSDNSHI